ncbi:neutral zinc metallopeptidase [Herbidospora yilanensis]|uniref:neutral zinc metallopeptidase n=1 Tax=Herbidospora yilanensis TaxID=354426 RepID=UPI000785F72B|nr:neutral zinc metallopeptidase [Herbidospora yilanensis]
MQLRRLLAISLLALTTSCGSVTAPDPEAGPAPEVTTPDLIETDLDPPADPPSSDCEVRGENFSEDVRLARCMTEEFWTQQFTASGGTYQPISRFVEYNGDDGPACGDQPAVPNNAFYCPDGHFIAYDATWLQSLYDQLGDGAVYLVIPHEFGHSVQNQLMSNFEFSVQAELQADCYAGGTLNGLIAANRLQAQEGDDVELMANLEAAGDPTDAWWEPGAHGTAQQRQLNFARGFERGVGAC